MAGRSKRSRKASVRLGSARESKDGEGNAEQGRHSTSAKRKASFGTTASTKKAHLPPSKASAPSTSSSKLSSMVTPLALNKDKTTALGERESHNNAPPPPLRASYLAAVLGGGGATYDAT